jgi:hypothetical protein
VENTIPIIFFIFSHFPITIYIKTFSLFLYKFFLLYITSSLLLISKLTTHYTVLFCSLPNKPRDTLSPFLCLFFIFNSSFISCFNLYLIVGWEYVYFFSYFNNLGAEWVISEIILILLVLFMKRIIYWTLF